MSDEYKVIVVKLPFDVQERLLTFPFLHLLRNKYPEADLHFITPRYNIEILNLLPFKAYYHEYDENDFDNIFAGHRFCATARIYNVDLFISLTNSFVDASLGLGLRAKYRLGFGDGWNTVVLNKKINRPRGHHISEDFIELYRELTGDRGDLKTKIMSRNLSPIISDWDSLPYIAINLSPLREDGIEEEIIELINHFEGQRIIIFASEDQEKFQVLIDPFMMKLSRKNLYVNFVYKNWIDLGKMLAYAKGVITFNGPVANFSAYVGGKTLMLFDSENPQMTGPLYYLSDSQILSVNDPTVGLTSKSQGSIQERKRFNMNEVYGKAFEFLKLVIERPQ